MLLGKMGILVVYLCMCNMNDENCLYELRFYGPTSLRLQHPKNLVAWSEARANVQGTHRIMVQMTHQLFHVDMQTTTDDSDGDPETHLLGLHLFGVGCAFKS